MKKATLLKSVGFLLLLKSFAVSEAAAQQTLTLQPGPMEGMDTMVRSNTPSSNHNVTTDFAAWYWTFSGDMGEGRSLLKFDLSGLPAQAVVTSAYLSLYYNPTSTSNGQEGANASRLRKVTSDWDVNTVTWNTKPATTMAGEIALAQSTNQAQDYPNIDVTSFVTDAIANPGSYYGWELSLVNPALYKSMKFASSNHTIAAIRPKLVVNYSSPNGVAELSAGSAWQLNQAGNNQVVLTNELQDGQLKKYQIFSIDGRKMAEGEIKVGSVLNTSFLSGSGFYLLSVLDEKNPVTLRFLKQ